MATNTAAANHRFELLYARLHGLATRAMAGERKGHTLQPTALVHEAWLRLALKGEISPDADGARLVHAVAWAMRQVLIDHARRRKAEKRGGKRRRVPLDSVLDHCAEHGLDTQDLHDALDALAQVYERQATIITLRFLFDYTVKEVAEMLDVSEGTVENDYRLARAWLRRRLNGFLDS
jgi:RNA polymerase sigma factor (TIGR02999 family)